MPHQYSLLCRNRTDEVKKRQKLHAAGIQWFYDDIKEIPKRYPDVDLALLHLGGTRILGLVTVTMDAKDGVRMMQIIMPEKAIVRRQLPCPVGDNHLDRLTDT